MSFFNGKSLDIIHCLGFMPLSLEHMLFCILNHELFSKIYLLTVLRVSKRKSTKGVLQLLLRSFMCVMD